LSLNTKISQQVEVCGGYRDLPDLPELLFILISGVVVEIQGVGDRGVKAVPDAAATDRASPVRPRTPASGRNTSNLQQNNLLEDKESSTILVLPFLTWYWVLGRRYEDLRVEEWKQSSTPQPRAIASQPSLASRLEASDPRFFSKEHPSEHESSSTITLIYLSFCKSCVLVEIWELGDKAGKPTTCAATDSSSLNLGRQSLAPLWRGLHLRIVLSVVTGSAQHVSMK
jgi:hypothetical protein